MQGALKGTAGRMLHHPAGKKAKHHTGYNFAVAAREKQLAAPSRFEELLQFFFSGDRQEPAARPVNINGMISGYVVGALGKIDGDTGSYRPPDVVSSGLRKFAKERVRTR